MWRFSSWRNTNRSESSTFSIALILRVVAVLVAMTITVAEVRTAVHVVSTNPDLDKTISLPKIRLRAVSRFLQAFILVRSLTVLLGSHIHCGGKACLGFELHL